MKNIIVEREIYIKINKNKGKLYEIYVSMRTKFFIGTRLRTSGKEVISSYNSSPS